MSFRQQIKSYAKSRLSVQYGTVLGGLILVYLPYYCTNFPLLFPHDHFMYLHPFLSPFVFFRFLLSWSFILILPFVLVGTAGFGLTVARGQKASCTLPYENGGINYPRKLGGSCWMILFIFLWSLLFIIPGIIKGYAYSFTPYILSEHPNVKAKDALKLSMKMTYGAKSELFLFDLSFIGWWLLTALTFGILSIYVAPYYTVAHAAMYDSIKNNALARGIVTREELNGI